MKTMNKLLVLLLILALVLPVHALEEDAGFLLVDPLEQKPEFSGQAATQAQAEEQQHPSKEAIAAKWATVTQATSLYVREPVVSAPYETGELTDNFLESGITYLNYIRFVAGLPEVQLDETLCEDAQYGAVLLAAVDYLSHTPGRPSDMDSVFYKRGYNATSSSNISARWGYAPLGCIQGSLQGCLDDSGDNNLATVGHRRWLLNPTLGKVGFGYAQSAEAWSYIVTPVFDRSGAGCEFDFISWPINGNQPTNLFNVKNPWSVTLNSAVYQTPSADSVKITITRVSDGKQWNFDSTTGQPTTHTNPYMIVNNQWYGLPNCIIFHPGSVNVDSYMGLFQVKITGIYYTNGTAAELNYEVDFFDIDSVSCAHSYNAVVTEPTCESRGYTTYTCSKCGDCYVDNYTDSVDHVYEDGKCVWCGAEETYVKRVAANMVLTGSINLNYSAVLSDNLVNDPTTFVRFTWAGKTLEVPMSEAEPYVKNGVTRYRFSCKVFAKQMTDEVVAQVMTEKGPVGEPLSYSVAKYCYVQMSQTTDQELINACKAILNYGTAAQKMFGYNLDNLANADLSEEDKVVSDFDTTGYAYYFSGSEEGIAPASAKLILDEDVAIRVTFKFTGDKTIDQYTLTVDGKEVEPVTSGNRYYVELDGIAASKFDEYHAFSAGGLSVNYCVLSYAKQVYESANSTEAAVEMVNAMYAYYTAIAAYVTPSDASEKAELTVSGFEKTIAVGDTYQIDYTYTGDKSKLTWSSSKPDVVSVDQNGIATALAEGNATIRVTDGTTTKRFKVYAESLAILGGNVTLTVGDTCQLDCIYIGNKSDLMWTSTNNAVATVNQQGLVTAEWNGNATIQVTDGNRTAQIFVTVEGGIVPEANEIVISSTNAPFYDGVTKYAGDYTNVTFSNRPYHSEPDITVTSSDPSVVSVIKEDVYHGEVTVILNFHAAGSSTITVTSADGAVSQSYTINVLEGYDFDPGDGQLTPEEWAHYATQVMVADGFTEAGGTSWLLFTLSEEELNFDSAVYEGRRFAHTWWQIDIRYAKIVYIEQNEDGKYVFHICH